VTLDHPVIKEEIAQRVAGIRHRMDLAAREAGRSPRDIILCAACKAQPDALVRISAETPIDVFGENRMQELRAHQAADAYLGKPCHFIGQMQTNKVRQVVGQVDLIQSVDRLRLLRAIQNEAQKQNLVQNVLIQVNLGEEDSKAGVHEKDLMPLMEAAGACDNIRVKGLMAIPPIAQTEAEARRYFARLFELARQVEQRGFPHVTMEELSMGMSGSYEAAIKEGATIVRIGTEIYGRRPG